LKVLIKASLSSFFMLTGIALGAPITFNTALPVHEGGYVLREQFMYIKTADDPSAAQRDMRVSGVISVFGYGVTSEFALFGVLPWFDKRLDLTMGGQNVIRHKSGIGDLTLLGRYTAYQYDAPGRTLRIAPIGGVKVPSGENNVRDKFGRLPPPVQVGSGSWDVLGGAVITYQTLDFEIDSQLSYKVNGEADGFKMGDIFKLDGSLQYRLLPSRLGSGVPAFLYGVLEANLIHSAKDDNAGTTDSNSGGVTLLLSPGVQYVTKRWIVEGGLQAPVIQHLNGTSLKKNYILSMGVRINL